jgi:crotonobetainyl-CoA:carnitine CoA-transferase CaiB-like acyl-CoA transferase
MWVLSPDITATYLYGRMLPSAGEMPSAPNPLVGTYFCADGKGLVLMMLQAERFWPLFAATVGREDLLARYATAAARFENAAAIREELAAFFLTRPRAAWEERLRASECIWGPFQTPAELADDPQVQANGYLLEAETSGGPVRLCANPVQFGGEPPVVRAPAADAGADTEAVLLEHGCTWDELAAWKEAGVIS